MCHNDSIMTATQVLERRFYSKGKLIVKEGEEAYVAFIIQSGTVSVFSSKNGQKIEYSKLGVGDIFGETSLIQDKARSASVEAAEDCNLIVITRDVFNNKLLKSDSTIQAVVKMLTARMLKSNEEIKKTKGVNIDSFISLLNQLFRDLLEAMPNEDKDEFRTDAFPAMKSLADVLEKYRDKL